MRIPAHILALAFAIVGCNDRGSATKSVPILQPFQGSWHLDDSRTLALWREQGMPPSEIEHARATLGLLVSEMNLEGNVATLPGIPEGEFLFFALHPHNQSVCGKAWYHEDRHDPGDMSKCYVRLQIVGADLHFSVRMADRSADPNDPDVISTPTTAGSAATCTADSLPSPPWAPWTTYVLVNGASQP